MTPSTEPTRPRTLALPAAIVTTCLTVVAVVAGIALAFFFNSGTGVATWLLLTWCLGHFTAASLAFMSRRDYGAFATVWGGTSLALMGVPFGLVVVGYVWLSQQQFSFIGA